MEERTNGVKTGSAESILQEDLRHIAEDEVIFTKENAEKLRGKGILVTGATGLVGSMLIRSLYFLKKEKNPDLRIYGVARNNKKAEKIYGDLLNKEKTGAGKEDAGITMIFEDITDNAFPESVHQALEGGSCDYIFHCAAVTTSKMMVEHPVETIDTALCGTKNLLETARREKASSFVYLSSMEVYGDMSVYGGTGDTRTDEERADEHKLGYIDIAKVRSNYPESKRMCENMCIAYGSEYGVPVKIARLAQTFGAGILPWENRVFAQFARSALEGKDIVLHTQGHSEGNYCYTADCVRGLLLILLEGKDKEAYNVANESTHTTIREMAEMVAGRIAEGRIRVVYDIPESNTYGYAADTKLFLDSSKLQSLGWVPEVGLEQMYRRMMAYMQEEKRQNPDEQQN